MQMLSLTSVRLQLLDRMLPRDALNVVTKPVAVRLARVGMRIVAAGHGASRLSNGNRWDATVAAVILSGLVMG